MVSKYLMISQLQPQVLWLNGLVGRWMNPWFFQVIMVPSLVTGRLQCWHSSNVPLQATYLVHQVPLQDIHHVHFDLEDLSFQDFEEEIVLGNGSDVKTGSGSDDALELSSSLQMEPCLPFVTKSLLAHHDHLFSKPSKECFPKRLLTMTKKRVVH